jgi:hypothetical protein
VEESAKIQKKVGDVEKVLEEEIARGLTFRASALTTVQR